MRGVQITGAQRKVVRTVRQLRGGKVDSKTIASTMCVSIDYVKDLCQGLIQDNFLRQGPGGQYIVTSKIPKMHWVRPRIQTNRGRTSKVQTNRGRTSRIQTSRGQTPRIQTTSGQKPVRNIEDLSSF